MVGDELMETLAVKTAHVMHHVHTPVPLQIAA